MTGKKFLFAIVFLCALTNFVFFNFFYANVNAYAISSFAVDVTGLNYDDATQKATKQLENIKDKIEIKISFEEEIFEIKSQNLILKNIQQVVMANIDEKRGTSFFDKINFIKQKNKKVIIDIYSFFSGFDEQIALIEKSVTKDMLEPEIKFFPKQKNMFQVTDGVIGVKLEKEELKNRIKNGLNTSLQPEIALPVVLTPPTKDKDKMLDNISLRASFSTNYSSSVGGRRHNVKLSLSAFDGLVVNPNKVVSFNEVVDQKIPVSQFKMAKIILNGEFVDGIGGGMCQASTTLYNALLLADMSILESHSHTLPVGYVKLGFDAMVNPGTSDLVFKNITDSPIYIKTYGDFNDCFVEIYGENFPKGVKIKRKSEYIKSIKHNGDKIIPDKEGKFADKILFKGEFHRVKYPKEGCEAKSYLEYIVDGEVVEQRFVRYSRYNAQQGIIYEGIEDLIEGLTEPEEKIAHIPPQEQSTMTEENVTSQTQAYNPSHYNP